MTSRRKLVQQIALMLVEQHAAWTDAKVAEQLTELLKEPVQAITVYRWRQRAGLPPALSKSAGRVQREPGGYLLPCGHVLLQDDWRVEAGAELQCCEACLP